MECHSAGNASQQTNTDNGAAGLTNAGDEIIPMLFPSDDKVTELVAVSGDTEFSK